MSHLITFMDRYEKQFGKRIEATQNNNPDDIQIINNQNLTQSKSAILFKEALKCIFK